MTTHKMPTLPKMSGSTAPTHPCACGCGMPTKRSWYPGHDGRATGWAIRIERGVMAIGDVPANEQDGARLMLLRRAEAAKVRDAAQAAA